MAVQIRCNACIYFYSKKKNLYDLSHQHIKDAMPNRINEDFHDRELQNKSVEPIQGKESILNKEVVIPK